jgi:hypothetical protein
MASTVILWAIVQVIAAKHELIKLTLRQRPPKARIWEWPLVVG